MYAHTILLKKSHCVNVLFRTSKVRVYITDTNYLIDEVHIAYTSSFLGITCIEVLFPPSGSTSSTRYMSTRNLKIQKEACSKHDRNYRSAYKRVKAMYKKDPTLKVVTCLKGNTLNFESFSVPVSF